MWYFQPVRTVFLLLSDDSLQPSSVYPHQGSEGGGDFPKGERTPWTGHPSTEGHVQDRGRQQENADNYREGPPNFDTRQLYSSFCRVQCILGKLLA